MSDDLFGTQAPGITDAEALGVANAFGLHGTIRRLGGERDLNFLVREDGDRAWVLKVPHPAEDWCAVELRIAAFEHCARRAPELGVPRLHRTPDGAPSHEFHDAEGLVRRAYVVGYIDGPLLHEVPLSPELRRTLGATVACLDATLEDFVHAPSRQPLVWDLAQAGAARQYLSFIPEDELRMRAERAFARFAAEAAPSLARLRKQFIHNDVNPHNVVAAADGRSIAGIIDFGDLVQAPLVNEVAIAAAYQVTGEDPIGNALALVQGYHAVSPLLQEEIELLPTLMATRMAVAVAVSSWRAEISPGQRAYITRNRSLAAAGLATLDSARDLPRQFAEALT